MFEIIIIGIVFDETRYTHKPQGGGNATEQTSHLPNTVIDTFDWTVPSHRVRVTNPESEAEEEAV